MLGRGHKLSRWVKIFPSAAKQDDRRLLSLASSWSCLTQHTYLRPNWSVCRVFFSHIATITRSEAINHQTQTAAHPTIDYIRSFCLTCSLQTTTAPTIAPTYNATETAQFHFRPAMLPCRVVGRAVSNKRVVSKAAKS